MSERPRLPVLIAGIATVLVLFLLIAVISVPNLYRARMSAPVPAVAEDKAEARMSARNGMVGGVPGRTLEAPESPVLERKIIRTASLDLVVDSVPDTAVKIAQLATGAGGYVESSDVTQYKEGAQNGRITIRVPQGRLGDIREQIKKLGLRVQNEKSEARDVTREYVDTDARLRNYRAEEGQYLDILKRSGTIHDTLEVAQQLNRVRGDIERTQAELKQLSALVEMSSINVTLFTESDEQARRVTWKPLVRARVAFAEMLQGLADYVDSMVAFLLWLPVIVLWMATVAFLAIVGWKLLRWVWRRFLAKKEATT
jgi:hypothetical protein